FNPAPIGTADRLQPWRRSVILPRTLQGDPQMADPKTLLAMAGADPTPNALADSVLVLIDCQNEYVTGKLPLVGVEPALDEVAPLLRRARRAGTPAILLAYDGRAGSLFGRDAEGGAIHAKSAPVAGETVVEKGLPNSFAGTTLQAEP